MSIVAERLEEVAEYTERNAQVVRAWIQNKQDELGGTDSTLLGVLVNGGMVALGIVVAVLSSSQLVTALAVAWVVFNGYPLALAAWRGLLS